MPAGRLGGGEGGMGLPAIPVASRPGQLGILSARGIWAPEALNALASARPGPALGCRRAPASRACTRGKGWAGGCAAAGGQRHCSSRAAGGCGAPGSPLSTAQTCLLSQAVTHASVQSCLQPPTAIAPTCQSQPRLCAAGSLNSNCVHAGPHSHGGTATPTWTGCPQDRRQPSPASSVMATS